MQSLERRAGTGKEAFYRCWIQVPGWNRRNEGMPQGTQRIAPSCTHQFSPGPTRSEAQSMLVEIHLSHNGNKQQGKGREQTLKAWTRVDWKSGHAQWDSAGSGGPTLLKTLISVSGRTAGRRKALNCLRTGFRCSSRLRLDSEMDTLQCTCCQKPEQA